MNDKPRPSFPPLANSRRTRSPSFLSHLPSKKEHLLFAGAAADGDNEELLFTIAQGGDGDGDGDGDGSGDGDRQMGVESLAPPLPPPPAQMTDDAADQLGRAIVDLRLQGDRLGAELAATAIEIGCMVARRILESELKGDIEAYKALVRSAVRRLGEEHRVSIHLAPSDIAVVRAASKRGDGPPGTGTGTGTDMGFDLGIAKVEIFPDTNLTPGDCLVESDAATVDGRLGTRLEEIRRVLLDVINRQGADAQ